jgi:hypothetical protein
VDESGGTALMSPEQLTKQAGRNNIFSSASPCMNLFTGRHPDGNDTQAIEMIATGVQVRAAVHVHKEVSALGPHHFSTPSPSRSSL